jgi:hypothetical protein
MTKAIYIPTHNRPELARNLARSLVCYMDAGQLSYMPIYLVLDEEQLPKYTNLPAIVEAVPIKEPNQGIGFARNRAITHAYVCGHDKILMLDDDSIVPENIGQLLTNLDEHPEIGWCGGYMGFYGIMGIKPNTGLWYAYNMACSMMAINAKALWDAGNFDAKLFSKEDDDAKIKLMDAGYYVSIDADVKCKQTGGRWSAGGCSSHDVIKAEQNAATIMLETYGPNFGCRKGRTFTQWKKLQDKAGHFPLLNLTYLPRRAGPMINFTEKTIKQHMFKKVEKLLCVYPITETIALRIATEQNINVELYNPRAKGLVTPEEDALTIKTNLSQVMVEEYDMIACADIPNDDTILALKHGLKFGSFICLPTGTGRKSIDDKKMEKLGFKKHNSSTDEYAYYWRK